MAVTVQGDTRQYSGNGVTTVFSFPFLYYYVEDIKAYLTDSAGVTTLLTQGTDYTVPVGDIGNPSGTSITLVVAPPTGKVLTLVRDPDETQPDTYYEPSALDKTVLMRTLDRTVMMIQRLFFRFKKSIHFPDTDPIASSGLLPAASLRAGMLLGFDNTGNAILYTDIGQFRGDWVTDTEYNFRDIVQDPVTKSLYVALKTYTSGADIATDVAAGNLRLVLDFTLATDAADAAEAAQSAAEAAQSAAESAQSAAETAETNAETAETGAVNAKNAAESAQSAAETAETNAETAEANAETAETGAVNAKNAAEAAAALIKPYDENQYAVASGTTTITATLTPAPAAYAIGMQVTLSMPNAASGASTLDLNGLGAKTIKKAGAAIAGGEWIANQPTTFIYDGTDFQVQNPGSSVSGAFKSVKRTILSTAGAASFTRDTNCIVALVELVGGGGGSGGVAGGGTGCSCSSGGSGGGYASRWCTAAELGASAISCTVGAKGVKGAAGNNNGTAGGTTYFGPSGSPLFSATGGGLSSGNGNYTGAGCANGVAANAGGVGVAGSLTPDIIEYGENGETALFLGGTQQGALGGKGGNSRYGWGGLGGKGGATSQTSPTSPNTNNPGAGGGGAACGNISTAGADGSDGIIIITEFLSV